MPPPAPVTATTLPMSRMVDASNLLVRLRALVFVCSVGLVVVEFNSSINSFVGGCFRVAGWSFGWLVLVEGCWGRVEVAFVNLGDNLADPLSGVVGGDCLAFFWFTDSRPAAPGVAAPAWIGDVSAFGSMHHVAFKVDADQVERYRDVLKQRGVKCAAVAHYLDGSMGETVDDDTFAYSIYFQDPDGITIEFCAWLPAYDKIGNQHQPVQALTPTPA